jgi:hypothetical protein
LLSLFLPAVWADEPIPYDYSRWPYPLHKEVGERLQQLHRQYPKLTELHTIGKSIEGRDLWVLEISNKDTGPSSKKPAMFADGNIHAREITGRQLLMYFAERVLANYGKDKRVTALVDDRVFYVMPIFDVDGGEKVLTQHPAWPEHKPAEHNGKDLDGDGFITQMRVKDPKGMFYPSPIDPRLMLQVRDRTGGRWNFIPTTWEEPKDFTDDLAPADQRYRTYTEGEDLTGEFARKNPPLPNFNRNWPAEWKPTEPGAGPYPLWLPEVAAVAKFMTDRAHIYFDYTIHSGGGAKNYLVRPPMSHPFEFMPPEDNDFYTRVGAIWSHLSEGGVMNNNYYAQEVKAGRYGDTMTGFKNDWSYMHLGIHSLLPEISAAGRDYDEDGYVTQYEVLRWNDEEKGGKYYAPWKKYKHPTLGEVEVGGLRGMPQGVDDRLKKECEVHYGLLLHVAGLAPRLRVADVKTSPGANGTVKVRATLKNEGFLSTYVTRYALSVNRDIPIEAMLTVEGGEVVGASRRKAGHILGKLAYIRRWGSGADESLKTVEWTVKPAAAGRAMKLTVQAGTPKAGEDSKTVTVNSR